MSARTYSEDGPEDTGAYVGGVACSGHNGSLSLYQHPERDCCKPSAAHREVMAAVRAQLVIRAAETARQQARG